MMKRTITGLIMALIIIPLMIIPQLIIPFQIVMMIGVVVAVLELIKMFEKEKPMDLKMKIITVILTLGIYIGTAWFTTGTIEGVTNYLGTKFMVSVFLVVIISLGMLVWVKDFSPSDVGRTLSITFYVGLGVGSLVVLRVLGLRFISYLFLITVCTDVFAYLVGVKFGKNKMAPIISPKKSWEGAIAGTLIATLIASSYGIFYGKIFTGGIFNPNGAFTTIFTNTGLTTGNIEPVLIILLTFLVSVAGQTGDLIASKFKRSYDIKDFGNIFPGHGGVMDRFDSAFFASMFLVVVLILFAV